MIERAGHLAAVGGGAGEGDRGEGAQAGGPHGREGLPHPQEEDQQGADPTQTLRSAVQHTWCMPWGQMNSDAPRQGRAASLEHVLCCVVNCYLHCNCCYRRTGP